MRKDHVLLLTAALLLAAASACPADDDEGSFLAGEVAAGGHYTNLVDNPVKIGEYLSLRDANRWNADLDLDLFGGTDNVLMRVLADYRDQRTRSFLFEANSSELVDASVDYRSFIHNLDHDYLGNIGVIEGNPTPADTLAPGGKQIFHTDNDPLGRYYYEYQKFVADVAVDLPFVADGRAYAGFHDQRRTGYKQVQTIEHCAFCHVQSQGRRIDEQTRLWKAGVEATVDPVSLKYEYGRTEFFDGTTAPEHFYKSALHPRFGTLADEFSSRLIYDDVALPGSRRSSNDKDSHFAGLKARLAADNVLSASYTFTQRRNWWTGVEGDLNAWAAGWSLRPNRQTRVNARFQAYETQVDDYAVYLPDWRGGQGFGGQNFDWTRISSLNRQVYQGDLSVGFRIDKRRYLKVSGRYRVTDRDAMNQTQTNYDFSGTGQVEIPSTTVPWETKTLRLKALYRDRFGTRGNLRLEYAFTNVSDPYMNLTAMCEESISDVASVHDGGAAEGRLYYFQRERYGNGTNVPSQSHRIAARGSYQLSPRASVNAYVNLAFESNDDLNIYEFERTVLNPGLNLWTAPGDRVFVTAGYAFHSIESNANLCPPIFDG